jgi:hypothetical protein
MAFIAPGPHTLMSRCSLCFTTTRFQSIRVSLHREHPNPKCFNSPRAHFAQNTRMADKWLRAVTTPLKSEDLHWIDRELVRHRTLQASMLHGLALSSAILLATRLHALRHVFLFPMLIGLARMPLHKPLPVQPPSMCHVHQFGRDTRGRRVCAQALDRE